jgi:hypothetical protein
LPFSSIDDGIGLLGSVTIASKRMTKQGGAAESMMLLILSIRLIFISLFNNDIPPSNHLLPLVIGTQM